MPRGNPALCQRQTFHEPDSVTVKPKAELLRIESYYLYRLIDRMAVTIVSNSVKMVGWLENFWLMALQEYDPYLALHMMLQGSKLDEFETAIHTSAMDSIFLWLLKSALEQNIQIFMTSHSKEAIGKVLRLTRKPFMPRKILDWS